jgi:Stress responsive A/B Barrel Domain
MKHIFVHHVFFWLKEPDNAEARLKLETGLQTLGKIGQIQEMHIGVPAKTDRPVVDNSYSYSLLLILRDKADHDIYQNHPIHLKFVEEYSHLWTKVLVLDSVDALK